jgi:hypothetical protein
MDLNQKPQVTQVDNQALLSQLFTTPSPAPVARVSEPPKDEVPHALAAARGDDHLGQALERPAPPRSEPPVPELPSATAPGTDADPGAGVEFVPEFEPEPPGLKQLIEDLHALERDAPALALLQQLAEARAEDGDYPTFAERFAHPDPADPELPERLRVFGTDYVKTGPMNEQRLNDELLRAPLRRYRTARKRIASALGSLHKAAQDTEKRVQRRMQAMQRLEKGGTQRQRQLSQVLALREVDVFAGATAQNRLVYSRTGAQITLGCSLPRRLQSAPMSGIAPHQQEQVVRTVHDTLELDLPDQSRAISMAAAVPRLSRTVTGKHYARVGPDQVRVCTILSTISPRGTHTVEVNKHVVDTATGLQQLRERLGADFPEVDQVASELALAYTFQVAQRDVNDTLMHLMVLSDLPVSKISQENEGLFDEVLASFDLDPEAGDPD